VTLDDRARGSRVAGTTLRIPLSFLPNRGQIRGPVDYYAEGPRRSVYVGPSGVTLALTGSRAEASAERSERWLVKLAFLGERRGVHPEARHRLPGVVSYFSGAGPAGGPAFRSMHASSINDQGRLRVGTPVGGFTDDRPVAFQRRAGKRTAVSVSYAAGGGGRLKDGFGFDVGSYDERRRLVIDPAVFIYSGFIGGSRSEGGAGIAVDAAGRPTWSGRPTPTRRAFRRR
jgi:hypothetical protein